MVAHTDLMQCLGYAFNDEELLLCALSHRSFAREHNERLEFLGDAVLGLVVAEELYRRQPEAREGELSRIRSGLVNRESLADIARDLSVHEYIQLGQGERKSGGQFRQSILADGLEAIIGAIYLDGGIEKVRHCVLSWYADLFDDLAEIKAQKDAKSQLQEWAQARKMELPIYEAEASGKAHAQTFRVTCRIKGLGHETVGVSTSRRGAEQEAAQQFLDLLNE